MIGETKHPVENSRCRLQNLDLACSSPCPSVAELKELCYHAGDTIAWRAEASLAEACHQGRREESAAQEGAHHPDCHDSSAEAIL